MLFRSIKNEKSTSEPVVAILEIGDHSAGGIVVSTNYTELFSGVYFQFDDATSKDEILNKLKKDLSIDNFKNKEVKLIWNVSSCTIVPSEFSNSNQLLDQTLELFHGKNPFAKNLYGNITSIGAKIGWSVEQKIYEAIGKKLSFQSSETMHAFEFIRIAEIGRAHV